MSLPAPGFKLLGRGFAKNIVLIPGWATDYRVFNNLELDYNYLLPVGISPFDFKAKLLSLLQERGYKSVSVLGYSLGGFLACDFAAEYSDMVEELILLGIRKSYGAGALKQARQGIASNARAFLYRFYLNCFSGYDREGLAWFRQNLLSNYLQDFSLPDLAMGLDYLSSNRIDAAKLKDIKKIRIFHGEEDLVAPLEEALEVKSALAQAEFNLMKNKGHLLFLSPEFKEYFYNG